jgi:Holliday junction resolvase-like predicted endonuclease
MICGYSQLEFEKCFPKYIDNFINASNISRASLLSLIKKWYDGYSWDGNNHLYNPYSILSLFNNGKFGNYWFETGTPSFLMDFINKNPKKIDILFKNTAIEGNFPDFDLEEINFTSLLLQTGYLTIKSEKTQIGKLPSYELAIPNHEVNISLFTSIIQKISKQKSQKITTLAEKIFTSISNLDNKALQKYFDILSSSIPAVLYGKIKKDIREANFHMWFFSWFKLMGFNVIAETQSSRGNPDIILEKDNLIVICEVKYSLKKPLNELAIEAINQIKEKKYYTPYLDYDVVLLGVAFGDREIKSWIEPLTNEY